MVEKDGGDSEREVVERDGGEKWQNMCQRRERGREVVAKDGGEREGKWSRERW